MCSFKKVKRTLLLSCKIYIRETRNFSFICIASHNLVTLRHFTKFFALSSIKRKLASAAAERLPPYPHDGYMYVGLVRIMNVHCEEKKWAVSGQAVLRVSNPGIPELHLKTGFSAKI